MYKAIIVDDEKIIREWLSVKVEWQDLGFEVVGTFKNGKEALSFVDDNKVDLVLSDIKMPVMDGIEFVRALRKQGYDKKIILISGFDDFSYAKTAIQNGVSDYILKPVEINEITNSVKAVKTQLDNSQSTEKNLFEQNSYMLTEYIKLAQDKKLDLDKSYQALSSIIGGQNYCFVRISPDSDDDKVDLAKQNFLQNAYVYQECMVKLKSDYTLCEVFTPSNIVFICMLEKEQKDQMAERLLEILGQSNLQASIGISATYTDADNFALALSQADMVKTFKFFNGAKVVFSFDNDNFTAKSELLSINELMFFEQEIKNLALKGEMTEIDAVANELSRYILRLRYFEVQAVVDYYIKVIDDVTVACVGDEFVEEKYAKKLMQIKEQIQIATYLSQVNDLFIKAVNIIAVVSHDLRNKNRVNIEDILEYIINNISTINLNAVASYCCLTPKYFSKLFKEKFGVNFVDYLTEQKMKLACDMLKNTGKSILQIATNLGYADDKYFSKLFKRQMGITPAKYRDLNSL